MRTRQAASNQHIASFNHIVEVIILQNVFNQICCNADTADGIASLWQTIQPRRRRKGSDATLIQLLAT